ncbi:MAG: glycosyltransferase [Gemmatimonadaceae bacterium]|nr:glycosyltransferase [Gemmatimonadaceae bacterium]
MTAPEARPAWSVVIPTYARHETLSAVLACLAPGAQTLDAAEYEVVVTDDARLPATRALLAARFPWVRYIEGPGRGPAANRNHGAAQARGAWLAFTDDDTLPAPTWLAAYAAAAAAHPRAEALEGRTTCPGGFGTPMHYAPVNETGGLFWSCNIAVRRDTFRKVEGFDEGFTVAHMEDQDLRERLRWMGVETAWVPAAHVEHPPRRQPSGTRLGLLRAAEVRYLYKHGAARPVARRMLRGIASMRLRTIRALPWSADSWAALHSLFEELRVVRRYAADWERAAAAEFPVPVREGHAGVAGADDPSYAFARRPLPRHPGREGPTVSVVVPSWKRHDDLARCLRALAAQERTPDEILVVTREDDEPSREVARRVPLPEGCERVLPRVHEAGVVAALQTGLDLARGEIVVLTDDDAEARPDWIRRLLETFARDRMIGGVGGRDWQPHERGDASEVGRVQWFGRVIGRHHLGAGPARTVDVLKGVNCAFRAPLARAVGMDAGLRGSGAQVHWELALCLPMRRAGWTLVYDPAIAIDHHVAPRDGADQVHRGAFAAEPYADAVHNEARALAHHLAPVRWLAYTIWAGLVGTTAAPGLLSALRLRLQGHRWAGDAWRAARVARAAVRAARAEGPPPRWIPVPGSLP